MHVLADECMRADARVCVATRGLSILISAYTERSRARGAHHRGIGVPSTLSLSLSLSLSLHLRGRMYARVPAGIR